MKENGHKVKEKVQRQDDAIEKIGRRFTNQGRYEKRKGSEIYRMLTFLNQFRCVPRSSG
jgi:hypothetical protein